MNEINSKLEQEFQDLLDTVGEEIDAKLQQAESLLREACNLSDKYCIPFNSSISNIGQTYTPKNFKTKWEDLNEDFVRKFGFYIKDYGYGWKHSAVC